MALSGCDLLTISPDLLAQLAAAEAPAGMTPSCPCTWRSSTRWWPCITMKPASATRSTKMPWRPKSYAEGIRAFAADAVKLEQLMLAA